MACLISKKDFENLKEDSTIPDREGNLWTVITKGRVDSKKRTAHLFRKPNFELTYLFHDGENIKLLYGNGDVCHSFGDD